MTSPRTPRQRVFAILLVGMMALCQGCWLTAPEPPSGAALEEGVNLCKEGKWAAAIPHLKQHLLAVPQDMTAHFYLGRCYLFGGTLPVFGAAEGEFLIALDLFRSNGKKSPISEYSDTYFELRCHLELAKVYLLSLSQAMALNQPQVVRGLLYKCEEILQAAKAIDPQSPDVQELEHQINNIKHSGRKHQTTPQKEAVAI